MAVPTDRGFVVIRPDGAGTSTVLVCAGITDGRPGAVFASYGGVIVDVASDITLRDGPRGRYTLAVAEVFAVAGGVVAVRSPVTVAGMPS